MRRGLMQTSYASQVTSRLKSLVEPQSAQRAETEAERIKVVRASLEQSGEIRRNGRKRDCHV